MYLTSCYETNNKPGKFQHIGARPIMMKGRLLDPGYRPSTQNVGSKSNMGAPAFPRIGRRPLFTPWPLAPTPQPHVPQFTQLSCTTG